MKENWHGLLLEFHAVGDDGGPGLQPGFHIEEVSLVRVEDEQEFRENHPTGTPNEIFEKHWKEIDDYLYQQVSKMERDE